MLRKAPPELKDGCKLFSPKGLQIYTPKISISTVLPSVPADLI